MSTSLSRPSNPTTSSSHGGETGAWANRWLRPSTLSAHLATFARSLCTLRCGRCSIGVRRALAKTSAWCSTGRRAQKATPRLVHLAPHDPVTGSLLPPIWMRCSKRLSSFAMPLSARSSPGIQRMSVPRRARGSRTESDQPSAIARQKYCGRRSRRMTSTPTPVPDWLRDSWKIWTSTSRRWQASGGGLRMHPRRLPTRRMFQLHARLRRSGVRPWTDGSAINRCRRCTVRYQVCDAHFVREL